MDKRRFKDLIKPLEGQEKSVYLDSNKIPTVGFGANLNSPDIPKIFEAQGIDRDRVLSGKVSITPEQADKIMDAQLAEKRQYFDNIRKKDFPNAKLDPNQEASLMSMMYNNPQLVGPNMRKLLNENNTTEAAKEILLRSNKGGVPGIQLRRLEEAQEFLGPAKFDEVTQTLTPEERSLITSRIDKIQNVEHRDKAKRRFKSLFPDKK
jgi:GH24 family phage-related lysozyme (muramidase)